MCTKYWNYVFRDYDPRDMPTPRLLDYPEKFAPSKRDIYLKQIIGQLAGAKIPEAWFGMVMVKSGEQYVDTVQIPQTQFDATRNRPRMIANPARQTLGIP
jgi:hypothetical protein